MENTNNEMAISFDDLMNAGSGNKFAPEFSDGLYTGMVIGATREDVDYDGTIKTKDFMIVQLFDDNGVAQTLKTGGYVPSLNDKSSCYKLLSGLTKEQDPIKMKDKLVAMGLIVDGQFSFANFLGKSYNFMITMTPTKAGKLYPKITSIMLTKANQSHEFKPDVKVPWFFVEDAKVKCLMEGVEVFTKKSEDKPELDPFNESLKADLA